MPDGPLVDLFVELETAVTADIHQACAALRTPAPSGILEYSDVPIVSSDIIGNAHSSIYDMAYGRFPKRYVRALNWYDNEWGYSSRVCDLLGVVDRW